MNSLGTSQETERNWLKNALQCELNQLKLGEVGTFWLRNGGVKSQQFLFGQIELRCVFFSAGFDAQKGREYQGHLNMFAWDDGIASLGYDNSDISKRIVLHGGFAPL